MQDLESLTLNSQYDDVLKSNRMIQPIWILLVDGGSDENPKYLKNINSYCQLFKKFDLDFLSIRTHALGQSKYNPVKRGMATLSGEALCKIWRCDLIFGKKVETCYVDTLTDPFEDACCCGPPRAKEAMDFLHLYNSFLPPITKVKDSQFTNPIYLLQYGNLLKIPGYDVHCAFIEKNAYL
ncbi:hypothetical protein C1646_752653 [Rhizophagus diaphanus]|nr:hypothetical protein C1646_752653 [Rhizophagus diaphanus] [Rhizophagus sp. MUCL 43196]